MKNLFWPSLPNRWTTGYLNPDLTLRCWCGAYQYCLKVSFSPSTAVFNTTVPSACEMNSAEITPFYILFFFPLLLKWYLSFITVLLLSCWHCLQKHSIYCSLYKLQSYWTEYNLKWQNNPWRSAWHSVEFLQWWACHADPRCIKKPFSKVTAPFAMMAHNKRITY